MAGANPTKTLSASSWTVSSIAAHSSRRRAVSGFLEYIVKEVLAGRGERLKGYNVALAVFDRAETFDPNIDPIVRL